MPGDAPLPDRSQDRDLQTLRRQIRALSETLVEDERIDDRVAELLAAGANVVLAYDDDAGELTVSVEPQGDGSGLDADLLDGKHAADLAGSTHTHPADDITSGKLDDARISESSVTQHEGALTILVAQISDFRTGMISVLSTLVYNDGGGFVFDDEGGFVRDDP